MTDGPDNLSDPSPDELAQRVLELREAISRRTGESKRNSDAQRERGSILRRTGKEVAGAIGRWAALLEKGSPLLDSYGSLKQQLESEQVAVEKEYRGSKLPQLEHEISALGKRLDELSDHSVRSLESSSTRLFERSRKLETMVGRFAADVENLEQSPDCFDGSAEAARQLGSARHQPRGTDSPSRFTWWRRRRPSTESGSSPEQGPDEDESRS